MHVAHSGPSLSQFDLNLLVGLDALLELRSVTMAARRLGLSQSAMSHQLRRLREMLDDPLLVPGKGGMVPTPRAEHLHAPVRRALRELGRAMRGEVHFDPATAERTFVIATTDVVEVLGLPPMLDLVSREAPGLQVEARLIDPGVLAGLQDGHVDIVLGPDLEQRFGVRVPGLRSEVVSNDETVCMLRREHPVPGHALDLDTFLGLRHMVLSTAIAPAYPIEDMIRRLGRNLDVAARVSHFMSVPFAIAGSDLAVTVPRRIAAYFAKLVPLKIVELPEELRIATDLVMSWHERYEEDPANRWLRGVTAALTMQWDAHCDAGRC